MVQEVDEGMDINAGDEIFYTTQYNEVFLMEEANKYRFKQWS